MGGVRISRARWPPGGEAEVWTVGAGLKPAPKNPAIQRETPSALTREGWVGVTNTKADGR